MVQWQIRANFSKFSGSVSRWLPGGCGQGERWWPGAVPCGVLNVDSAPWPSMAILRLLRPMKFVQLDQMRLNSWPVALAYTSAYQVQGARARAASGKCAEEHILFFDYFFFMWANSIRWHFTNRMLRAPISGRDWTGLGLGPGPGRRQCGVLGLQLEGWSSGVGCNHAGRLGPGVSRYPTTRPLRGWWFSPKCSPLVPQCVTGFLRELKAGGRSGCSIWSPAICCKFPHRSSLVRCPCAFRLRRLAQIVGTGFGSSEGLVLLILLVRGVRFLSYVASMSIYVHFGWQAWHFEVWNRRLRDRRSVWWTCPTLWKGRSFRIVKLLQLR